MMFLQQKAQDPFTATPERTAQVDEVASRIADFIDQARATLDIAVYDFHLHDDAARIIANALRSQARTLLLCIHQLNDAERICDRLLLLAGGRLVGVGTLAELRAQTGLSEGSLEEIFLALT